MGVGADSSPVSREQHTPDNILISARESLRRDPTNAILRLLISEAESHKWELLWDSKSVVVCYTATKDWNKEPFLPLVFKTVTRDLNREPFLHKP